MVYVIGGLLAPHPNMGKRNICEGGSASGTYFGKKSPRPEKTGPWHRGKIKYSDMTEATKIKVQRNGESGKLCTKTKVRHQFRRSQTVSYHK